MLFRISILIILILLAIPIYNKGKDYWDEKIGKAKAIGQSVEKAVRYGIEGSKEK